MSFTNSPKPFKRALACFAAAGFLAALLPATALAWGDEGHHIVALIAERNLSDTARQQVNTILAGAPQLSGCAPVSTAADKLSCVATWADGSRFTTHKNTYNWHFVDISLDFEDYDAGRDCAPPDQKQKGKCGIFGLDYSRKILRGEVADPKISRAQALMFVVHIVGDLHQPLHTVLEGVGGNTFNVSYFGVFTNLHKVWDTKIIESEMIRAQRGEAEYADMLEAEIDSAGVASFQQGEPVAWLEEAHARAVEDAYGKLPKKKAATVNGKKYHSLGKLYFKHNLRVVNTQLERGGARLAKILNEDLG